MILIELIAILFKWESQPLAQYQVDTRTEIDMVNTEKHKWKKKRVPLRGIWETLTRLPLKFPTKSKVPSLTLPLPYLFLPLLTKGLRSSPFHPLLWYIWYIHSREWHLFHLYPKNIVMKEMERILTPDKINCLLDIFYYY